MDVGHLPLLARLSGTLCPRTCGIRRFLRTVTGSHCLTEDVFIGAVLVCSAQVFYENALYKFTFDIDIDIDIDEVSHGWTRDQEVAGSTPTAALFGQQPWASYSHLMCLCSPSSITCYLASCEGLHAKSAVLLAAA